MKGNVGEALVQYLLSHIGLVHKIDGSNDVGNDFICELVKDKAPTNLLFYVQVKFSEQRPHIKPETLQYWKDSPIPVYLFWIKSTTPPGPGVSIPDFRNLDTRYLRMTPIAHDQKRHQAEQYHEFDRARFKRDLLVDYQRSQYKQGFLPILEPRSYLSMDEKQAYGFAEHQIYIKDVVKEYRRPILEKAWVQPLVVADLLIAEAESINGLSLAEQSLALAESLYKKSGKKGVRDFGVMFERVKQNLSTKKRQLTQSS